MESLQTQKIPIFELYSIWYTPLLQRMWVRVTIGIAIIVFLVLLSALMYRFYKQKKVQQYTPFQAALVNLRSASVELYASQHAYDNFYTTMLIATLKNFVIQTFSLNPGMTDSELANFLANKISDLHMVESLLNGALYVKFAQQSVALDRMKTDLQRCIDIIHEIENKRLLKAS